MFLSRREQRLYEIRFVWIQKDVGEKRGTIRTHWVPTVCWKTFPANTTKILSTRNSSILMMSSSEYLLLESECSFTKYVSSYPNTKYLYLRLPFLKMNAFRIILVSLSFNFWWGMVVWRVEKSKDLMLVTRLKVGDLRCSNNKQGMQHNFEQQKSSNWVIYRQKSFAIKRGVLH